MALRCLIPSGSGTAIATWTSAGRQQISPQLLTQTVALGINYRMRKCVECLKPFASNDWTCPDCSYAPTYLDGFPCFAPKLARNNDNYDVRHFKDLFALETGNYWFEARNKIILWAIRRFFKRPERVLELGVGTGFVACGLRKAFPSAALSATDIHTEGLAFAAQRLGPSVDLLQVDGTNIPFRSEFDVVCLFDVLEHIPDDRKVLSEVWEALVPGGGLIITVPQHMLLWGPADEQAFHQRRYSTKELAEKVRAAGFDVLFKTSFVAFLLPLLFLARMRTRISGKYNLEQELRIPSGLNRLFKWILAVENSLICSGLRLPVGGSQLLVALRPEYA